MNTFRLILFSALAAIAYGILHDQITVRVCPEYFTVAHPPIFPVSSPTLLAVCWGAASTVGIGLAFGTVLALVSQSAGLPPAPVGALCRRIVALLMVMGACALGAALLGSFLFRRGAISMPAGLEFEIPPGRQVQFMAVWFAHLASYLVGFAGAGGLIFQVWKERGRPVVLTLYPRRPRAILRAALLVMVVALIVWRRFFALS